MRPCLPNPDASLSNVLFGNNDDYVGGTVIPNGREIASVSAKKTRKSFHFLFGCTSFSKLLLYLSACASIVGHGWW